jgi:dTMP kinase
VAAAKRERERVEAEAAAKRERARLEADAAAKRERQRLEAEAEAKRLRLEAEAARAAAEQARLEAEAAERERVRLLQEAELEVEIDLDRDPFADFRPEAEEQRHSLLRLMPLTNWATPQQGRRGAQAQSARHDDLHELMEGLALPAHVAAVTYASGCRIRRVRVPAVRATPRKGPARPVILSKRALEEVRCEGRTGR